MRIKVKRERVLELMREGWELGFGAGGRENPHVWLQKRLCCGGDTFDLNLNTFYSLRDRGEIVSAPKKKDDGYWLTRYVLANQKVMACVRDGYEQTTEDYRK